MYTMTRIQERFPSFFSEYFFQLITYVFALAFGVLVIIKLLTIEIDFAQQSSSAIAKSIAVKTANVDAKPTKSLRK